MAWGQADTGLKRDREAEQTTLRRQIRRPPNKPDNELRQREASLIPGDHAGWMFL